MDTYHYNSVIIFIFSKFYQTFYYIYCKKFTLEIPKDGAIGKSIGSVAAS